MKDSTGQAGAGQNRQNPRQRAKNKVRLAAACLLAAFVLFVIVGAASAGYTTTQLTNDEYLDEYPQINDDGQVVWIEWDRPIWVGGETEVFLYSGGITTQLTDNDNYDAAPQINDDGQVVWFGSDGNDYQIFLYSGGTTTQLTGNAANAAYGAYNGNKPQINNSGQVVWQGDAGANQYGGEVFLYSPGTGTQQLTDNAYRDGDPQINNSGQVVWHGGGSLPLFLNDDSDEIFLYTPGTGTQQLTDNGYFDGYPHINNIGQVAWQGGNGEIFLYTPDSGTQQLTDNGDAYSNLQINNNGQVVWQGKNGEIFLYSGGITSQLTDNDYWDVGPQINDSGQVVWGGGEIFLYSGGTTTKLTNNDYSDDMPQINDAGQVVWQGDAGAYRYWVQTSEIFLASPCAEVKPSLSLSRTRVYWASYADYTNRILSVNYSIANGGTDGAYGARIAGTINAPSGVTSTNTPVNVGDIAAGGSAPATVKYHVPSGVSSFKSTVYTTANDACGNGYSYPGPYPGL